MEPSLATPPRQRVIQRYQEHNLKHPSSMDLIIIKQNKTNYFTS